MNMYLANMQQMLNMFQPLSGMFGNNGWGGSPVTYNLNPFGMSGSVFNSSAYLGYQMGTAAANVVGQGIASHKIEKQVARQKNEANENELNKIYDQITELKEILSSNNVDEKIDSKYKKDIDIAEDNTTYKEYDSKITKAKDDKDKLDKLQNDTEFQELKISTLTNKSLQDKLKTLQDLYTQRTDIAKEISSSGLSADKIKELKNKQESLNEKIKEEKSALLAAADAAVKEAEEEKNKAKTEKQEKAEKAKNKAIEDKKAEIEEKIKKLELRAEELEEDIDSYNMNVANGNSLSRTSDKKFNALLKDGVAPKGNYTRANVKKAIDIYLKYLDGTPEKLQAAKNIVTMYEGCPNWTAQLKRAAEIASKYIEEHKNEK